MKKILLAIALIFSFSLLFGFKGGGVEIKDDFILLSLDVSSEMISQSIRFSLNNENIKNLAFDLKEELDFKRNLIKEIDQLRNEFLFSFALTYVDNPEEKFKINSGVILTKVGASDDYVGFDIIFTSIDCWNYYHHVEGGGNKNGRFLTKISSEGQFPFSALNQQNVTLGEIYKNKYLAASKGLSFEEDLQKNYHPQFIYNYSTSLKMLRSNAQALFKGDGKYHHVWIKDEGQLKQDGTISLSLTIVNKGLWLALAISLPLSGCIIYIIIIKFRSKKQKK